MSKLSELLNPVSNAIVQEASVETQSPGPDAQDDHPSDQQSKILAQDPLDNHTQHPHMESPLQALANAATSTAPLMSPTHPLGSPLIAGEVSYQSHSSSRPTSSRMSPPLPLELSRQPEHPLAAISPGLEQYHHSPTHKGHARKLSEPDGNSGVTLPPLRGSFIKKDSSSKAGRKSVDTNNFGGGEIRIEPERLSPEEQSVKPKKEPGEALGSYKPFQEPSEPFHSTQSIDSSQSLQTTEPPQSLVALESNGLMLDKIKVKAEAMDNSSEYLQNDPEACEQEESLNQSSPKPSVATADIARPRNVTYLKNDESYQPSLTDTEASIQNASAKSKPAPSRKRAAPKSKVGKKGTASAVKPAAKRRKVDSESATATPSAQRSGTPASTRASKTPAPRNRKQESVTPAPSSSVAIHNEDEEDEDDDEDNELFCICRKPDDHTWMIACDGPCQDWFHGRCVEMNEKDGNLIDKYICPNCQTNGVGQTTWKPMCRLQSCRDPARVSGSNPSKYCSDEHGKEYMQNHVLKQDLEPVKAGGSKSANNKKRRRDDSSNTGNDRDMEEELEIDDAPSYLRGGVLRATELKALTGGVKSLSEFRKLGEGVLSPPRTASPDNDVQMDDADGASTKSKAAVSYTAEESSQLTEIAEKNDALKTRKSLLGDREKFLGLVKARAKSVLEELKKRDTELKRKDVVKDICGYDVRLSWSDEEFQQWRASPEGLDILTSGVLGPPAIVPTYAPEPFEDLASPQPKDSNTAKDPVATVGDDVEIGRGVCQKRHCVRHKTWWKLQQQDMALEKEEVRLGMRKLEEDEKGVRDRAMIRCLESGDGGS